MNASLEQPPATGPVSAAAGDAPAAPPPPAPGRQRLKIRPESGWAPLNLRELWDFRDLLVILGVRDIKLRYRQTALGVIWVVLQPVLAAAIFALIFGKVAGLYTDGMPPFLFAFAGLIGWTAFSGTLNKAGTCLVGNAHLVSKVYFPRVTLPLSNALSTLVDFGVGLIVMSVLLIAYRVVPGWQIILLPVWLAVLLVLAMGIALFVSALSVSYRDVQYVVPVVLQLLLYASPIAYSVRDPRIAGKIELLYDWNPLAALMGAIRSSLLGTPMPEAWQLAYATGIAVLLFITGAFAFRRMERRFADVI